MHLRISNFFFFSLKSSSRAATEIGLLPTETGNSSPTIIKCGTRICPLVFVSTNQQDLTCWGFFFFFFFLRSLPFQHSRHLAARQAQIGDPRKLCPTSVFQVTLQPKVFISIGRYATIPSSADRSMASSPAPVTLTLHWPALRGSSILKEASKSSTVFSGQAYQDGECSPTLHVPVMLGLQNFWIGTCAELGTWHYNT